MHRYDRNCMSVWKIARNLKLAIRLKLLRPVSNSKYLGFGELLPRVRILSSCEELLSQHFSTSWPERVRQTMEQERLSRRGIRPVYENGWDVCYNQGVQNEKKGSSFGTRPILNYIKCRPRLVRIDIDQYYLSSHQNRTDI